MGMSEMALIKLKIRIVKMFKAMLIDCLKIAEIAKNPYRFSV